MVGHWSIFVPASTAIIVRTATHSYAENSICVSQAVKPSFVKFELGFSCLTSRAFSLWRPKKSPVRPSVRWWWWWWWCPQKENLFTKSKAGQKTRKNGVNLFGRAPFDKFLAAEMPSPFLKAASLSFCVLAPAQYLPVTEFEGRHP